MIDRDDQNELLDNKFNVNDKWNEIYQTRIVSRNKTYLIYIQLRMMGREYFLSYSGWRVRSKKYKGWKRVNQVTNFFSFAYAFN